jgi:hypothetical protein
MTRGRSGSGGFAIFGRPATGAPAGRRASSKVPHIPQKRKLSELSSPHFGQITLVLQMSLNVFSYSLTLASNVIAFVRSY